MTVMTRNRGSARIYPLNDMNNDESYYHINRNITTPTMVGHWVLLDSINQNLRGLFVNPIVNPHPIVNPRYTEPVPLFWNHRIEDRGQIVPFSPEEFADVTGVRGPTLCIKIESFEIPADQDPLCCICMVENKKEEDMCKFNCEHIFCVECTKNHLKNNNVCPLCRTDISRIMVQTSEAKEFIEVEVSLSSI
jgi:hypothetical protein